MEYHQYDTSLPAIINTYDSIVKVIDDEAREQSDRAYGGAVRSVKGKLQEYITHSLIMIAWKELNGDIDRINIDSKKIKIPIQKQYLSKITDKKVATYIKENIHNYHYGLSVDKHVFIDNKFVLGIECKSYTENAMLKRIMIDFDLLRTVHKDMSCYLFQLESQLGGDYSKLPNTVYGSQSSHTIMSYFNTTLHIVTLLKGERDINNPIHKSYKQLDIKTLRKAKDILKRDMRRYV